jgi:hypothetical protein
VNFGCAVDDQQEVLEDAAPILLVGDMSGLRGRKQLAQKEQRRTGPVSRHARLLYPQALALDDPVCVLRADEDVPADDSALISTQIAVRRGLTEGRE